MFTTFALFLEDNITCNVYLHLGAQHVIKLKKIIIPIIVL
jgi:hypothetical protein